MPNQLYHDLQTMVKDNFFSTARQQILDPTKPLYVFLLTNDLLEQLFSIVRCLTHNRNVDHLEFAQRASIATRIMDVYGRHPDWNRSARRLAEAFDRMNVNSWPADVSVEGINVSEHIIGPMVGNKLRLCCWRTRYMAMLM